MSKGNLFMGNASGKLADVVLYRNAGAQVARLRVRTPRIHALRRNSFSV